MNHSSAIIAEGAIVPASCSVGPFSVIGPNVVLGENCVIHSHVVIDGHTTIGEGNEIYPFASIGLKSQDLKWKGGVTRTTIGDRNTIREYVSVHSATGDGEFTAIGNDNYILAYCHIAHNVVVGNRVVMSNLATLAGHVVVGDHVVLGGMAGIHQFCRVGRNAMVGGCSKVTQDVPPFMLADGNPAEIRMINKVGLERNGFGESVVSSIKKAYRFLYREGNTLSVALAKIEADIPPSPEIQHLVEFARTSPRGLTK